MAVRAGTITGIGIIATAEDNFNERGPRERAFFVGMTANLES
jgi:hypothetical protein